MALILTCPPSSPCIDESQWQLPLTHWDDCNNRELLLLMMDRRVMMESERGKLSAHRLVGHKDLCIHSILALADGPSSTYALIYYFVYGES